MCHAILRLMFYQHQHHQHNRFCCLRSCHNGGFVVVILSLRSSLSSSFWLPFSPLPFYFQCVFIFSLRLFLVIQISFFPIKVLRHASACFRLHSSCFSLSSSLYSSFPWRSCSSVCFSLSSSFSSSWCFALFFLPFCTYMYFRCLLSGEKSAIAIWLFYSIPQDMEFYHGIKKKIHLFTTGILC